MGDVCLLLRRLLARLHAVVGDQERKQARGLGSARRSWTSSAPALPGPAAARASAARPAARSPPSAAAQMSARPHRPGWRWRQGCACRRQTFGTSSPASATGPRAGGRRSAAPAQAAPCSWPPGRSRAARSSWTMHRSHKRRSVQEKGCAGGGAHENCAGVEVVGSVVQSPDRFRHAIRALPFRAEAKDGAAEQRRRSSLSSASHGSRSRGAGRRCTRTKGGPNQV